MNNWLPTFAQNGPRPVGRPLLAISDIHGDLEALNCVLDALKEYELCGIVAAGDHVFGGPQPFETWQRLHELGATMTAGETDIALAQLRASQLTPNTEEEEAHLLRFLNTRDALGQIICRRLGELPSTAVVSLDDRKGVMVLHSSPRDEIAELNDEMPSEVLAHATACVAEDVLVVGKTHTPFVRRIEPLMIINAGSVGKSPLEHKGWQTAHAVLIQGYSDHIVRARGRNIPVRPARSQKVPAA